MLQVAPEPAHAPADQHIESAARRIGHEPIERGPTVLRSGDGLVNVFGCRPVTRLGVAPEAEGPGRAIVPYTQRRCSPVIAAVVLIKRYSTLKKVAISGGPAITLATLDGNSRGGWPA